MSLPTDSNSLLVPVFLNAWVVDESSQQVLARYEPDYSNLESFGEPLPPPQIPGQSARPTSGIYLKWALPDALTHAAHDKDGSIVFPHVPNRWVIIRNTPGNATQKAWVIQSDHVEPNNNSPTFLDPNTPSSISNDGSTVTVNGADIGKNYTIDAWESQGDPGTANFFLKAVGPGNISFAAYQPFSSDVFSFVDSDLPAIGTGTYSYSYMVVGWYSDPAKDPLAGATSENFADLLKEFLWSLPAGTNMPATPPVNSLYHGFLADVQWPYDQPGHANLSDVDIAVGNSAADALSALVQNYAVVQSKSDPNNKDAWLAAGNTMNELIQAAMLQLLDDYGVPGGQALVTQQVVRSWFGSAPGGTLWKVASSTAQNTDFDISGDQLTPAQNAALVQQLAKLNTDQQTYDTQERKLQSLQQQLYILWLNIAQSQNFGFGENPTTIPDWSILSDVLSDHLYPDLYKEVWELCCTQATALAALPPPADKKAANEWANNQWTFPAADGHGTVTLSQLNLVLKGTAAPGFQHPVDPVVLVNGAGRANLHGEDGNYNEDGTMTVRLPGQTITGLQVDSEPDVTAAALETAGVVFDTLSDKTSIPGIPKLLAEAFFCAPSNGTTMAGKVSGTDASKLSTCIQNLLNQHTAQGHWDGTPPSPVGTTLWTQAWAPLWMEWGVNYYPTADAKLNFEMDSWTFDGTSYTWNGGGFSGGSPQAIEIEGRSVVSPYTQTVFKTALNKYLQGHPKIDNAQLDKLLDEVMGWDILSQSLSGMTDQLITLLSQTTFPPPTTKQQLPCSMPSGASPSNGPKVGNLVQDQYHHAPILTTTLTDNTFFPVRGALVNFSGLQIVDVFGQTYQLNKVNTPSQGFKPLLSPSLTPPSSQSLPAGVFDHSYPFVLNPRLVQGTRLNMEFLVNDGSDPVINSTDNNNPICGWLLANHLDNSLDVYDSNGVLLGELNNLGAPNNWRPRPGAPGANPPPATPADIANTALKNVIVKLAAQTPAVFEDFIQTVDETLWMSDPLGGKSDTFLSALIGRPLAVTMMELSLELDGNTATSQLWDEMLTSDSTKEDFTKVHDTGGVENIPFPLRLGSIELRNDGLLGYFLPDGANAYDTFYAVHPSPTQSAGDHFIKPIMASGAYQGDLSLKVNGYGEATTSLTVTLISDPLGVVHGYTGVLPVQQAALPAYQVQDFLKTMLVNFQTGPVVANAATVGMIRTPLPAEKQGTWDWLQHIKGDWVQDTIVNVDDAARFPLKPPVLKEGWLQLRGVKKDD
ncbi:MAG: hypothetical protein AAFN81_18815 [Bacteroidota bacterium]